MMAGDRDSWRGRTRAGEMTPVIDMTEASEDGGVAPPFELTALRAALRGVTKEYA
jgi:hypothetical protein